MRQSLAVARTFGLAAALIAGCGFIGSYSLRTDPTREGSCGIGVGRDATLHGSAADPELAWAIDNMSSSRVKLIWPAGYTARFGPQLAVLDRAGNVVAREGDLIIGSCLTRPEDGDAIQVDPAEIRPPGGSPATGDETVHVTFADAD